MPLYELFGKNFYKMLIRFNLSHVFIIFQKMEGAARTDRASKGSKPFVLSIILRSLKKALIRLDFFNYSRS